MSVSDSSDVSAVLEGIDVQRANYVTMSCCPPFWNKFVSAHDIYNCPLHMYVPVVVAEMCMMAQKLLFLFRCS